MITISTFELLSVLYGLISSDCYTVDVSLNRDHSAITFTGTNENGTDFCFEPILDQRSPDALHSYRITKDALAPYIPSFGELTLLAEACTNAAQSCASTLDSSDISVEQKLSLSQTLTELQSENKRLHNFLTRYFEPEN